MNTTHSTATKVRLAGLVLLLLASGATIWAGVRNRPVPESLATPAEVLAELQAGNTRFKKSQRTRSTSTRGDGDRRKELAKGEKPIAAVVTCSDSRVVPEVIFDQALGRLLTVHDNEPDAVHTLGTAVDDMHVPLVVVLAIAHAGCEPNTEDQARALARSLLRKGDMLQEMVRRKSAAVTVAVYHLDSGQVDWSDFDPDAEK
jgi:carbonic anhydrase